jgi:carbonic anhydrase
MIDDLFDRNVAWAMAKTRSDPDYFRRLAEQQAPQYLWLGCSDSRVPANEIVGLDPGELFVHRNLANVVHTGDMNLLSVVEFAVQTLHVKQIIVCGHYDCGGIRRAFERPSGSGLVDHWLAPVREMCRRCSVDLARLPDETARINRACELNVEMQVRRVAATPILRDAWRRDQPITVHGWIYGLEDGLLRDLGLKLSSLYDAEKLDREEGYAGFPEPITMLRRHAVEAFAGASIEPQFLEEGSTDGR